MTRPRRSVGLRRLVKVWASYSEFRRSQVAPSTYARDYAKISRRLDKMRKAAPDLKTSIEIRDWLLENYAAETARRTIQQLNAAYKWAQESDMVAANPFAGVHRHIRPKRPSDRAWASFTIQERDRIIAAFEDRHPYYAPWVKCLFWTGARPEELAALRGEHLSPDCTELLLAEAWPIGMEKPQSTKNYRSTRFPCNNRLQRLLRLQCPPDRELPLFPGRAGGRLHYTNFQRRYWRPLVMDLVQSGAVAFYLSQYHCRHTFITEALAHGVGVADVSYLCRVSTGVLYQHYAGRSRGLSVPEF